MAEQPGTPFVQYVAYTAPHWPLHTRLADIAKYAGRFDRGWDCLRAERLERMIQLGVVAPDCQLSTRVPAVPAWEDVSTEHEGNAAVRDGDWKLVLNFGASPTGKRHESGERGDWELYQTAADPAELRNIASAHPDRVQHLKAAWDDWARRVGVIPREEWLRRQQQARSTHD